MSEKVKQEANVEQPKQSLFVEELQQKGTALLTAKTKEELTEMVNDIPADVRYGAGAVGFDYGTGMFCLQIHLVSN